MPGANPATTPVALDLPDVKAQYAELGGYTVGYESFPRDIDPAALFVGLPDDRCQCPHWGQVLSGSITLRYEDGTEEVNRAGDVFYWPAGHVGWTVEGVEMLELSRTEEIMPVLEHIGRQLAPA